MKRSQGGGGAFWRAWTFLLIAAGLGCFAFFFCGLPKEGDEALSRKMAGGSQLQSAQRAQPSLSRRSGDIPLVIYQQYHDVSCHPYLSTGNPLYRGLNQASGQLRSDTDDIDVPAFFEIGTDPYYQNLLCEFTGILAVALQIERVHPHKWIGFQSWKATEKERALTQASEKAILSAIAQPAYEDAVFFWADGGVRDVGLWGNGIKDFYGQCDSVHIYCSLVYQRTFELIFGERLAENEYSGPPPMPIDGGTFIFMSYFVMRSSALQEYARLVKAFFVTLNQMYFHAHKGGQFCILAHGRGVQESEVPSAKAYESLHCYCYLLERLINIWAYHSGRRMLHVNVDTGEITEQHPVEQRDMWSKAFKGTALVDALSTFESRLRPGNEDYALWNRLSRV